MVDNNFEQNSYAYSVNVIYIQELYNRYLENPVLVDKSWHEFFQNLGDSKLDIQNDFFGGSWAKRDLKVIGVRDGLNQSNQAKVKLGQNEKKLKDRLIDFYCKEFITAYRNYGFLQANLDPINLEIRDLIPELDFEYITKGEIALEDKISAKELNNKGINEISQLIAHLKTLYTKDIAYEFEYIVNSKCKKWLRENIENSKFSLDKDSKKENFYNLMRAEVFEQFLHKKFQGVKRFSIEGGASLIPALLHIRNLAMKQGIKHIDIGMAHRGRLNVLVNVVNKPYTQMLAEFKGKLVNVKGVDAKEAFLGDVKYHMGYDNCYENIDGEINMHLAYNPSHLEAVNAVLLGKVRARQDLLEDKNGDLALGILIHGDAAVIGQGVVAETINMSKVEGHKVGGVIHIIVDNQIGFTARPKDSRSSLFSSNIFRSADIPIIHVNGNNLDEVINAVSLAFRFRQEFKQDVVVNLICYRKYGHNEGDEPNFTQPIMYGKVKTIEDSYKLYLTQLVAEKILTVEEGTKQSKEFEAVLVDALAKIDQYKIVLDKEKILGENWAILKQNKADCSTGVKLEILKDIGKKLVRTVEDIHVYPKLVKLFEHKQQILEEGKALDWSLGEALAFATLLVEGYPVRITGQDAKRGTFSHRHSVLRDINTEQEYIPLNKISNDQAKFQIYDSVLSEFGVLGFEYGYARINPKSLVVWEAQFGDFANGAQIIFDQFIASAEEKWLFQSGVVMLLPHGFEGQGPEHSSARLERYLQSCANNNIIVANITTPANMFHILRRQVRRNFRKPLIIMTPKSLLRHKLAVSAYDEFAEGTKFQEIIPEVDSKVISENKVKKIIICSGKIYYDLYSARQDRKINDIVIIRLEQYYPYPEDLLSQELRKYQNADIFWCQEEPVNMGAWFFLDRRLEKTLHDIEHKCQIVGCIARVESASPATGYAKIHAEEQAQIVDEALS